MAELTLLVVVCGLATYAWRGLGVLISGRIGPGSETFSWIACVAYAMIAGLVARMLVMPTGALEATTLAERALATAAALIAYFVLTRRNLFAGVSAGAGAVWLVKLAGALG